MDKITIIHFLSIFTGLSTTEKSTFNIMNSKKTGKESYRLEKGSVGSVSHASMSPDFDPQHPHKDNMAACVCNPRTREAELHRALAFVGQTSQLRR